MAACLALVAAAQPAAADAWSDEVLAQHNTARARCGARPLTWNVALYASTLEHAQSCQFRHSTAAGKYGENLFVSTAPTASIRKAVAAWMDEASKYDYGNPTFSGETGHFTQLVWKSTTQVTAAIAACPAGTILPIPTTYVVARYTPPGNYLGQFPQNVGRPVT
ncbi:hypothetical protein Acsp05_52210 [Actinokineospora sp. NBRC 105648]|nr:hypothetical protein Acsp05_52210 [Actinokineospora sp. NBRC 105648]